MKKFTLLTLILTLCTLGSYAQDMATKLELSRAGGNPGCLAPTACNYDETADYDDGSCEFPGCSDETACNFDPEADCEGECFYTVDCNGECGGVYIQEDCNCYNPNFGEYEVTEVPFAYESDYNQLPGYTTYSLSDDDMDEAFIPFSFPYFGMNYSELWISSNGFISFTNLGDDDGCCQGSYVPSMDNVLGAGIAPNWADYYPSEEGVIYTAGDANYFMIGFDGVPTCCGSSNYTTWQLILYPDGSFTMNIETIDGNENIHTIGFQDGEATQGESLYYEAFLQLSEVAYHVSIVEEPEACPGGCTDEQAINYDSEASEDDGSCLYYSQCDNIVDAEGNGADFYNYYAPSNWTFENIGGEGSYEHDNDFLFIEGSNTDLGEGEVLTQVTISASATGTYSFNWDYSTDDEDASYDIGYYINGVRVDFTDINGGFIQNGFIEFEANEGDLIGFGIDATDDCCGAGFLEITNFRYPYSCLGTCFNPSADNYDISGDYYDFYSCVWTNECGQETDSNGNGSGFVGEFAPELGTEVSEGNGSIEFNGEDGIFEYLEIIGSDEEAGTDVNTGWTIIAPVSGTYSFAWDYYTEDETSVNDPAYYYHNGINIITEEFDQFGEPIGSGNQSGWIQFEVEAGDEIGFGVLSVNDCCGEAYLGVYAFAWPIPCVGGCMDETALNYNPDADYDNDWCAFMNDCEVMVNAEGDQINFTGDYAPELWDILSEGDGLVQIEETQMDIWGSDTNEKGSEVLTQATIEILVDGTYSFDWTYFTVDGANYDIAYFINDERTDLTLIEDEEGNGYGNSGQSGSVSIELTAGTILGFGIEATDDCCGLGTLTINHFTHPSAFCLAGCTDEGACNFNPEANFDDDSCDFETCAGCLDPTACNYDEEATIDSEDCDFESCVGCMDETALNYDAEATVDSEDCVYECVLPEVTFDVANCEQSEFSVVISIATIGNGAPYTISNSYDDVTETAAEAGDISFGSFPTDEVVVITIVSAFGEVCEITSEEIGCPIGIEEYLATSLVVYPNPANSTVTIASDVNELVSIQLFDVAGRLVMTENTVLSNQGFSFNVSMLAEGSYVVKITTENGIFTEQMMIQH